MPDGPVPLSWKKHHRMLKPTLWNRDSMALTSALLLSISRGSFLLPVSTSTADAPQLIVTRSGKSLLPDSHNDLPPTPIHSMMEARARARE